MRFTEKALDELREIYQAEFHEEITLDQAAEIGTRLIDLLKLLLRPSPRETSPDPRTAVDSPRQGDTLYS